MCRNLDLETTDFLLRNRNPWKPSMLSGGELRSRKDACRNLDLETADFLSRTRSPWKPSMRE